MLPLHAVRVFTRKACLADIPCDGRLARGAGRVAFACDLTRAGNVAQSREQLHDSHDVRIEPRLRCSVAGRQMPAVPAGYFIPRPAGRAGLRSSVQRLRIGRIAGVVPSTILCTGRDAGATCRWFHRHPLDPDSKFAPHCRDEAMPIIHVEMFAGRTSDQKRALVKELTDGFIRSCGGKPESVQVIIEDVTKENWAVAGELMSDKYPF